MKPHIINPELWKGTVDMLSTLITYAEYMVKPSPEKEKLLPLCGYAARES